MQARAFTAASLPPCPILRTFTNEYHRQYIERGLSCPVGEMISVERHGLLVAPVRPVAWSAPTPRLGNETIRRRC